MVDVGQGVQTLQAPAAEYHVLSRMSSAASDIANTLVLQFVALLGELYVLSSHVAGTMEHLACQVACCASTRAKL